nr:hypothetical protein [Tanacetum cinerariifolium]
MDTTIDQQVAMDEALVPHARRLRIRRINFRLLSDIKSKESTLQLVYDVLRLTPFFKAFLVTADVLEIYMHEFWATATVHHHSIRFKMDNKKHIVNLESFREMLHICLRLPHQPFVEPPFEEEILAFLRFLGHSRAIRRLTDVKHKDMKKSNEMYYHRFTKVIIHHFMSTDPSIPRRNKVNWPYVRDDHMFTTIKLVSRHQNTQQFGALLPIELTNKDIRNSKAYKEYYAVATGAKPPKPKANEEEFIHPSLSTHAEEETKDEESFDPIPKTPENTDDEGNGGIQMGDVHQTQEFEDSHVTLTPVNPDGQQQSSSVSSQFVTSMLNPTTDAGIESIFETTLQMDVQTLTLVGHLPMYAPTLTPSTIATITTTQQTPTLPTTAPSTLIQDIPNFESLFGFDYRLKTLEANFFEFMQTNKFAGAVSSILEIV